MQPHLQQEDSSPARHLVPLGVRKEAGSGAEGDQLVFVSGTINTSVWSALPSQTLTCIKCKRNEINTRIAPISE